MRKSILLQCTLAALLMIGAQQYVSGQYSLSDTTLALKYIKEGDVLLTKGKADSAMILADLALAICQSVYTEDNLLFAKALSSKGKALGAVRNFKESLIYLDQAYAISQKLNPEDAVNGQILMNKGVTYSRARDFHESLRYFEMAKAFMTPRVGEKNSKMLSVFGNLATGYYNLENYKKAIFYDLKAIEVLEANAEIPRISAGIVYSNTGVVYRNLGDYANSLKYNLKGLAVFEKMNSPRDIAEAYNSIGITHATFGNTKMGLEYLEKAKDLISETKPELVNYNLIGHIYTLQKKHGEAIAILQKQIELNQLKPGLTGPSNLAGTYYYLGRVYFEKGDFVTAESHFLKALETASVKDDLYNSSKFQYFNLCGLAAVRQQDFEKANHYFDQSAAYFKRFKLENRRLDFEFANLHANRGLMYQNWYSSTRNKNYLYKAIASFREFDRTLDNYNHKIEFAGNLRTLSTDYRPGYDNAIRTAFLLASATDSIDYQVEAFNYTEKTKFMQLRKNNQELLALRFGGIPEQQLELENDLRVDIAYFEKQQFALQQKGVSPTDSNYVRLNNKITDLSQQHELLKRTFESDYPDYYRLKYEQQLMNISDIQRDLLQPNEAMISYTISDSSIFVFAIDKEKFRALEVKKDFDLESLVLQMRSGMTDYFVNPALADQYSRLSADYADAASKLYEKLIAPIASQLPENVVIIPDGILGYIPFEALLAEKPADPTRWNRHHYLQNDHTISYCYSASMLQEMRNRKHAQEPESPFVGFAPRYEGDTTTLAVNFRFADNMRKDLQPLPNSGEEVYRAAKIMNGQSVVGAAASEALFVASAGKARVLHLATHGQANDRNGDFCFLVFSEQKDSVENEILYAREIYNLRLNADLVTLSACETGIGELQNGEGMISLSRAFSYAGAKSIVTSLWSVSDSKTKDLMVGFYKNIHAGLSKDAALRETKLTFLKTHKGLAAHPFYWAGFIGIGDMTAVKQ